MDADPALEQPTEGEEGAPKTHIPGCVDLFEDCIGLPENTQGLCSAEFPGWEKGTLSVASMKAKTIWNRSVRTAQSSEREGGSGGVQCTGIGEGQTEEWPERQVIK